MRRNRTLFKLSERMLQQADELFMESGILDTIVRDTLSDGIARIVWCAYDTQACALHLNPAEWDVYTRDKTFLWFESKGYTEWFCRAASELFVRMKYPHREVKVIKRKGKAA